MIIGPFFMAKHNFIFFLIVFFVFHLESQVYIPVVKPDLVSSNWPKKPFQGSPLVFSYNLQHIGQHKDILHLTDFIFELCFNMSL